MGGDMTGAGDAMSFFQWQTVMVQLASLKYKVYTYLYVYMYVCMYVCIHIYTRNCGRCASCCASVGLFVRNSGSLLLQELRAMKAMRIMLRKWLVPMVYVHVPRTIQSDFVFTSRIVTLCLTYETHLRYLLVLKVPLLLPYL